MATITFNQAGLSPAGITNRSRSDGLIDGSEVTITLDQPGFVSFVDVPEGDVDSISSLTQTGPSVWKFTPTAGVFGSWLVEAQPFAPDTKPVRRVFAVRSPEKGLRVPAFNERASSQATATTGVSFVDESDDNEGGTYRGWARSLAELFRTVANGLFTANKVQESGGPATLNVSTIPASGVLRRNSTSQIVGGPVLVDNAGNITGAGTINGITPFALSSTAPVTSNPSFGSSAGVATDAARGDHRHGITAGTPVALVVGGTNAVGSSGSVARADHVHATPGLATTSVDGFMPATSASKLVGIAAGADVTLTALSTASADIAVNSRKITGLADPTNAQDACTKAYADAVTQGLDVKPSCRVIATGNITLSGTQTIDSVAVQVGNRVLCAGQTAGETNGIYLVASGAWTRALDADTSADVSSGMFTFVVEGTGNADSGWVLITVDPIVLGSTPLVFTQFSGAGQIQAGPGLTKTGNTLNVVANADGSIVVAADDVRVGVISDTQHGSRGGGTQHAVATTSVDGFMLAADKVKLDGIASGAAALTANPPTQITVTTAAAGSGTAAAKSDHTHSVSTGAPAALAIGSTQVTGVATSLARSDHVHAMPAAGLPISLTPGLESATGVASTFARSDHLHFLPSFGTTVGTFCQGNDARLLAAAAFRGNQCRLSGQANSPVMLADNANVTTLYLLPHVGDLIGLYNTNLTAGWAPYQIPSAGLQISVSAATNGLNDVFVSAESGTPTLGFQAWASSTTRQIQIQLVDGVWVKTGDQFSRYIGTIFKRTATSFSFKSGYNTDYAKCDLWNADNRVFTNFSCSTTWLAVTQPPSANTWFYPGTPQNAYKFEFILGRAVGTHAAVDYAVGYDTGGTGARAFIGLGYDANPGGGALGISTAASGVTYLRLFDMLMPTLGQHTIHFMALGTSTAVRFYTTNDQPGPVVYGFACSTRWEY